MSPPGDRHSRQERFAPIGAVGQRRIAAARVAILGCGGLGANSASLLARAGVGFLRIVDRDVVELSNLPRQTLFLEADAGGEQPKAVAAARRLAEACSEVRVEPVVADVDAANIARLLDGVDLVLDGFDNFEGRFLLNEVCVARGLPWVHGACVGSTAMAALFVPRATACYRCLAREVPAPGAAATCDTAGIIGPAAMLAASLQVSLALRYLVEGPPVEAALVIADAWDQHIERLPLRRDLACPCCALGRLELLARTDREATELCGREAIAVRPRSGRLPDLAAIAQRLRAHGEVRVNEFLLRFVAAPYELTLFADGRAIVKGTTDPKRARSLVARWVGT